MSAAIDTPEVTQALAEADDRALRAALAYARSDVGLLHTPAELLPAAIAEVITAAPADLGCPRPREVIAELVRHCTIADIDEVYIDFVGELLARRSDPAASRRAGLRPPVAEPTVSIIVIGAGASGIHAASALAAASMPYVVLERNDGPGGTWHDNVYPGCAVDTPSYLYSFESGPAAWERYFAPQPAVLGYLGERSAGLNIRYGESVESVTFDHEDLVWRVTVRSRSGSIEVLEASCVISAVGMLNRPKVPTIPGAEGFEGPTFHTARWEGDLETVRGRRVGVIGSGASAVQLVPAIAGTASQVMVFQRSPHWMMPNDLYRRAIGEGHRRLLAELPTYATWYRLRQFWLFGDAMYPALVVDPAWPGQPGSVNALNERVRKRCVEHMRAELDDEQLLAAVTPAYPPYAKRLLIDNGWYRTLGRDDVQLVAERIDHIASDGVVVADGTHHPIDVLVYATGFETTRMLTELDITTSAGRSLNEDWGDDPRAHLGVTVPGYPNLFMLYGPNTNVSHGGSAIFQTECQVRLIMSCLEVMTERGWRTIEPRQEVHDSYNRRVDDAHAGLVWSQPGVSNWFRNSAGRVTTNSPWRIIDYWAMTCRADPNDYVGSP